MTLKNQLLTVATIWADANGHRSLARVSTHVFGDGKKFKRLDQGFDLTTESWEKAMLWFSQNWPPDTKWPRGIERP